METSNPNTFFEPENEEEAVIQTRLQASNSRQDLKNQRKRNNVASKKWQKNRWMATKYAKHKVPFPYNRHETRVESLAALINREATRLKFKPKSTRKNKTQKPPDFLKLDGEGLENAKTLRNLTRKLVQHLNYKKGDDAQMKNVKREMQEKLKDAPINFEMVKFWLKNMWSKQIILGAMLAIKPDKDFWFNLCTNETEFNNKFHFEGITTMT